MSMPTAGRDARFVFRSGGYDFEVVNFNASESISSRFQVRVTLASRKTINERGPVGKTALLTIPSTTGKRCFHGVIQSFSKIGRHCRFWVYEALVVPAVASLNGKKNRRTFSKKSAPAVVCEILKNSGVSMDGCDFRLKREYLPENTLVQENESDLRFLSGLLEKAGIFYFFEHSEENHVMVFADGGLKYRPIDGSPEIPFRQGEGIASTDEFVYGFSANPNLRNGSGEEAGVAPRVSGLSTCPRFAPGSAFRLFGHDRSNCNGQYVVLEVRHSGAQPLATDKGEDIPAGCCYSNCFSAAPYAASAEATPRNLFRSGGQRAAPVFPEKIATGSVSASSM
jgi:uncharacterized protein involved in type VI secretion and phage assembly